MKVSLYPRALREFLKRYKLLGFIFGTIQAIVELLATNWKEINLSHYTFAASFLDFSSLIPYRKD